MQQNEPNFTPGLKIDGFKLINHLGSGGTAEVWLVEDANLNPYAMKLFSPTRGMDEHSIRLFQLEFKSTEKLVHPNILRALKYGEYQNKPYIIFNLCDTSLMKILHQRIHASRILSMHNRAIFREEELANVIHQVAQALAYLHAQGIIHQDIKPDNILVKTGLNDNHTYLISDFGVSTDIKMTILRDSQILTEKNKGLTPDYAAPELYQGAVIPATDIFALGISIFELCTGRPPISNTSMTTAIALLNNNGFIPDLPDEYSQRFNVLVKKCLKLHPEDRPSAAQLVEWSTFYQNEGYWPEILPDPIPPTPTTASWIKYLKPSLISLGILAAVLLSAKFLWPLIFNPEAQLTKALESFDIVKAADVYEDLDDSLKGKYGYLNYLSEVNPNRPEIGSGFSYMVVKHKKTGKLGITDNKGYLKLDVKYDNIFKIHDQHVVTTKEGSICKQHDLTSSNTFETGLCKVFKSRAEFSQALSGKQK